MEQHPVALRRALERPHPDLSPLLFREADTNGIKPNPALEQAACMMPMDYPPCKSVVLVVLLTIIKHRNGLFFL